MRKRETLAFVFALHHFCVYLLSTEPFTVISYPESLKDDFKKKDLHGSLKRWLELFSEYEFVIQYKSGKENIPHTSCVGTTETPHWRRKHTTNVRSRCSPVTKLRMGPSIKKDSSRNALYTSLITFPGNRTKRGMPTGENLFARRKYNTYFRMASYFVALRTR